MAFTVTFPTAGPAPHPNDVASWLTEQGEPFEREGPHTLALKALPVRLVVSPEGKAVMQAQIEVDTGMPLTRLVDLLFELSVRAGADVRLAGSGDVDRPKLWLCLADEQARLRVADALDRAAERGNADEVLKRMWGILSVLASGRDVRWDATRRRIVELKEVEEPGGISLAEAEWHAEDVSPGDVVGVPTSGYLHTMTWCWLSEAYPGLAER